MKENKYLKVYADYLRGFLRLKRPLKIVFDASNGSGGLLFKQLVVRRPQLSVTFISHRPDGHFPDHGPNPLADGAIDQLAAVVKKRKADLGIIVDNDADRAFFLDETGRLLTSTEALIFIAEDLTGPVVVDFLIGPLAHTFFKTQKRSVVVSRVGLYFIKKAIAQCHAPIAAEYSGHFYFKEVFGSDCALMAAVKFMNKLSSFNISLSQWLEQFPRHHQAMFNFVYSREHFPQLAERLRKRFSATARKISDLDGIKIEFADYWLNLRSSNTEDLVRLTVEAKDKNRLLSTIADLKKLLR